MHEEQPVSAHPTPRLLGHALLSNALHPPNTASSGFPRTITISSGSVHGFFGSFGIGRSSSGAKSIAPGGPGRPSTRRPAPSSPRESHGTQWQLLGRLSSDPERSRGGILTHSRGGPTMQQEFRKLWTKPELIVIVRGKAEEAVLGACRCDSGGDGLNVSNSGCKVTDSCVSCALLSNS